MPPAPASLAQFDRKRIRAGHHHFISHIKLEASHPSGRPLFSRTIQIDKVLERGKFLFSSGEDAKLSGASLAIATHSSAQDFSVSLDGADDVSKALAGKKCFLFVVYKADSPLLTTYKKSMGDSLFAFPVSAELSYCSFGMKKHFTQPFEVTGLLHKSGHANCTTQQVGQ
ncbi:MAG: hypothetical protein ACK4NM_04610 [Hydrogenophaga sp.]